MRLYADFYVNGSETSMDTMHDPNVILVMTSCCSHSKGIIWEMAPVVEYMKLFGLKLDVPLLTSKMT